jgi:hypothetical protein
MPRSWIALASVVATTEASRRGAAEAEMASARLTREFVVSFMMAKGRADCKV